MAGEVGGGLPTGPGAPMGGGLEGGLGGGISSMASATEGSGINANVSFGAEGGLTSGLSEAQSAMGGPEALGPDVSSALESVTPKLDTDTHAGIEDVASLSAGDATAAAEISDIANQTEITPPQAEGSGAGGTSVDTAAPDNSESATQAPSSSEPLSPVEQAWVDAGLQPEVARRIISSAREGSQNNTAAVPTAEVQTPTTAPGEAVPQPPPPPEAATTATPTTEAQAPVTASSEAVPQPPPPPEAAAPGQAESDSDKRIAELQQEAQQGNFQNAAELNQLLKDKDSVKTLDAAKQKLANGETLTDSEMQLIQTAEGNNAPAEQLTPEQQAEKLQKDIEDLGTELMTKLANGEQVTPADLQKLQELRGQEALTNQGFTQEQARAAIKATMGVKSGNERQTMAMQEIQGQIQELMALELRLMSIPRNVNEMRKQRDQIKKAAAAKHNQLESATTPEQRLKIRGEEANLYMQIATANQRIVSQKYEGTRINARISDLEQTIRRKTGVTSGLTAVMEFAGAKVRNAVTEIGVGAAEEADYRTGNY